MGEDGLTDEQFVAFRDALAERDVECDGLHARRESASEYAFETPAQSHSGLDEAGLRRVAAEHAAYVSNWYFYARVVGDRNPARRAFVRWLETADTRDIPERYDALADGIDREWGELRLTTSLGGERTEGTRRYEIRHVDDEERAVDALTAHSDPLDARDIGTLDDDGRYRPLRTAPSLTTGWRFVDLDATGVYEAVETFYPATVPNWHREREGTLDVDHWRATAERQTGIYDVIDELPREALEWLTEACCVDSQCLRRREWQYDADDAIETPGGDGAFPCREPCSLVVAAARKWAILESEEPKTWEIELTTSEKNQLEAILEAVADGRTEEIREADVNDGANRYRARYLRAKRGDSDGLGWRPADDGE